MTELFLVSMLVVAVGLIGTIVPGLPGMPLILGGIALFTIGNGFAVVGPFQFFLFVVLGLVAMGLNFLGNLIGAQKFGVSRIGLFGALLGLVIGFFVLPGLGIIVGPLLGATAAELLQGRAIRDALRSGFGVLIGYIFGSLAEVLIALIMVGWFVLTVWPQLTGGQPPGGRIY